MSSSENRNVLANVSARSWLASVRRILSIGWSKVQTLAQPKTAMSRSRKTRVVASFSVVAVVMAAVVFGTGFDKQIMNTASDGAWLLSRTTGAASHASAVSGDVDYRVTFEGATGNDLAIVQREDGTYLLNRTTGELARMDESLKRLGAANDMPASASMELLVGDSAAYVVDRMNGLVTPIDPITLERQGDTLSFPSGFSAAIIDPASNLLVAPIDAGIVIPIVAGEERDTIRIGGEGDFIDLASVNGQPVAVNLTKLEFTSIAADGRTSDATRLEGIGADSDLVLSYSNDQPRLWILDRKAGRLHWVNPANADGDSFDIEAKGKSLLRPVVNGDTVYIPEPKRARVLAFASDGSVLPEVKIPKGADIETFVKDGRLWVNDPESAWAASVDDEGSVTQFDKYTKSAPSSELTPPDDQLSDAFEGTGEPESAPTQSKKPGGTNPSPGLQNPDVGNFLPPALPASDNSDAAEGDGTSPDVKGAAPGAPTDVAATAGNGQASISFAKAPANKRRIENYVVESQPFTHKLDIPVEGGRANYDGVFEGLENGTKYTFEVYAVNKSDQSGPRATSNPVTPSSKITNAPKVTQASPSDESVSVSWEAPRGSSKISRYRVVLTPQGGGRVSRTGASGDESSTTVRGLVNGTNYRIAVIAIADSGTASKRATWQQLEMPFSVPDAPSTPQITPADGALEVSFNAPFDNGRPIGGYEIQHNAGSGWITEPAPGTTLTIDGLANGVNHEVQVRAKSAAGISEWSSSAFGVPRPAPNAPQNLAATPGRGFVDLSWSAPSADVEVPLDKYRITVNGELFDEVDASTTRFRVQGLTGGRTYKFAVYAISDSEAASKPVSTSLLLPGPPQVQLSDGGQSDSQIWVTINVDWQGGTEDQHCQAWVDGVTTPQEVSCSGTFTQGGLTPATTYRLRVRATNTGGASRENIEIRTDSLDVTVMAVGAADGFLNIVDLAGAQIARVENGDELIARCQTSIVGETHYGLRGSSGYTPANQVEITEGNPGKLPQC